MFSLKFYKTIYNNFFADNQGAIVSAVTLLFRLAFTFSALQKHSFADVLQIRCFFKISK